MIIKLSIVVLGARPRKEGPVLLGASPAATSVRILIRRSARRLPLSPLPTIRGKRPYLLCWSMSAFAARYIEVGSLRWEKSVGVHRIKCTGIQGRGQTLHRRVQVTAHRRPRVRRTEATR